MSIDLTKIKTVNDAQGAKYNGRNLTDDEKKIFEHANLKSADEATIKKATEILEKVLKAKSVSSKVAENAGLLATLNSNKTSEDKIYTAINSCKDDDKGIYDLAIENIKKYVEKNSAKEELEKQVSDIETKLAGNKTKKEKLKQKEDIMINQKVELGFENTRIQGQVTLLNQVKTDLSSAGTTGSHLRAAQDAALGIASSWYDVYSQPQYFWQADFSSQSMSWLGQGKFAQRTWFTKGDGSAEAIIGFIQKALSELDLDEFQEVINNKSTLVNKTQTIADFKKLKRSHYQMFKIENSEMGFYETFPHNLFGNFVDEETKKRLKDKITARTTEDLDPISFSEMVRLIKNLAQDLNLFDPNTDSKPTNLVNALKKKRTIEYRAFKTNILASQTEYCNLQEFVPKNKTDEVECLYALKTPEMDFKQMMTFAGLVFGNTSETAWNGGPNIPSFELTRENNVRLKTFVEEMKEAYPELLPALEDKELNIAKLVIQTKMGDTERVASKVGEHTDVSLIEGKFHLQIAPKTERKWSEALTGDEIIMSVSGDDKKSYLIPSGTLNVANHRRYICLRALDEHIKSREFKIEANKSKQNTIDKKIDANNTELIELEAEEIDLKDDKASLERRISDMEEKDIKKITAKLDSLYGTGLDKPDRNKLWEIRDNLVNLEKQCIALGKTNIEAYNKFNSVSDAVKALEDKLVPNEVIWLRFSERGKSLDERLINAQKSGYLETVRDALTALGEDITPSQTQTLALTKINETIAGTYHPKHDEKDKDDDKTKDEKKEELKNKLGVDTVDEDGIYDTWKDAKDAFKNKVGEYASDTAKKETLLTHIRDENKGVYDDSKIDEADGPKAWRLFLAKGSEKVIKTIFALEYEKVETDTTKKTEVINKMKAHSTYTDESKNFNKDEYGDPDSPETITLDKTVKFLYDELNQNVSESTKDQKEQTPSGNEPAPSFWSPSGWKLWVLVVAPAIIALGVIIFWKQLRSWWNGPSDENDDDVIAEA